MAALGDAVSSETFSPVVVDFYREVGYRAEALLNYLLLLGWSLDGKTETFEREAMIKHFALERVNKSAASFDPQKLMAFQERHMQKVPAPEKVAAAVPFLQRAGSLPDAPAPAGLDRLAQVVEAAGDRIKVAGDILNYPEFFQGDEVFSYDDQAFDKRIRAEGAAARLGRFRIQLEAVDPFDAPTLDRMMHRFIRSEAITVGQIIHAVRVAVTGKAIGFGLFDGLTILGSGGVSGAHRPSAGATGTGTSMTDSDTSEVGLDFIRQVVVDDQRGRANTAVEYTRGFPPSRTATLHIGHAKAIWSQLRGCPGTRWVVQPPDGRHESGKPKTKSTCALSRRTSGGWGSTGGTASTTRRTTSTVCANTRCSSSRTATRTSMISKATRSANIGAGGTSRGGTVRIATGRWTTT